MQAKRRSGTREVTWQKSGRHFQGCPCSHTQANEWFGDHTNLPQYRVIRAVSSLFLVGRVVRSSRIVMDGIALNLARAHFCLLKSLAVASLLSSPSGQLLLLNWPHKFLQRNSPMSTTTTTIGSVSALCSTKFQDSRLRNVARTAPDSVLGVLGGQCGSVPSSAHGYR